ncbi:MAG: hypothetical protein ACRD4J_10310 [Nitrososphaeraceae archaeon]|jgi:hypothetical protein
MTNVLIIGLSQLGLPVPKYANEEAGFELYGSSVKQKVTNESAQLKLDLYGLQNCQL